MNKTVVRLVIIAIILTLGYGAYKTWADFQEKVAIEESYQQAVEEKRLEYAQILLAERDILKNYTAYVEEQARLKLKYAYEDEMVIFVPPELYVAWQNHKERQKEIEDRLENKWEYKLIDYLSWLIQ